MLRIPHLLSLFLLVAAVVLLIIVSVSLPYLPALDFTRVHLRSSSIAGSINQIRFGIWAFCTDSTSDHARTCSEGGHAYAAQFKNGATGAIVTIGSSWTRGLAIHPVAAIVAFAALVYAIPSRTSAHITSALLTLLAAFLTFIAFLCDIALFAYVQDQFHDQFQGSVRTITGPGFWITFASLLLLLASFMSLLFHRRQARKADPFGPPTRRPFWQRFFRSRNT